MTQSNTKHLVYATSSLRLLLLCIFCYFGSQNPSYCQLQNSTYSFLKAGFEQPPMNALPKVYWWWLNGYTDSVRLKEELIAMKKEGISGVDIFEIGALPYINQNAEIPAGPSFMGTESIQRIAYAIKEAGRLGMEVGLNVASSWNAGGSWTRPEHASKCLYFSKTENFHGHQKIKLSFPKLPQSTPKKPLLIQINKNGKPVYYDDVVVLAMPAGCKKIDTTQIINITKYFDKKTEILNWKAPAGSWDVCRYVCSNTGELLKVPSPNSIGPIIDHYDAKATEAHFMYFINALKPLLGNDFRNTALKYLYLASYEAMGSVWTNSLPATYKKLNGYDVYKLIPALFDSTILKEHLAKQFHKDYIRTLSQLIINNHYRKAKEVANKYGLKVASESGGPGGSLHKVYVDAIKSLGTVDIPRGEFWNKHEVKEPDGVNILMVVKPVATAAHLYNRPQAEEEAFTSFEHWQEGPFTLKPLADRAFCEGMSRVVVHGFTHNPSGTGYPGIVYHAGTHYNDKRIWWLKIKPFNEYLGRLSFLFQHTRFFADVLYYYGDRIPNFVTQKNSRFTVGAGYDYEPINTEKLLQDVDVRNGKLVLRDGSSFSMLALENEEEMNPDVLLKLKFLANKGAVIVGPKPLRVSTPLNKKINYNKIINELWMNDAQAGFVKGRINTALQPVQILEYLNITPDISYHDKKTFLIDYTHRQKDGTDFYLLCNTSNEWISRNISFRQSNKTPELWDAVNGKTLPIKIYTIEKNYTMIPITLAPHASITVAFKNEIQSPTQNSNTNQQGIVFTPFGYYHINQSTEKKLDGPWQVHFDTSFGGPATAKFEQLHSWTQSEDERVKYYSGIGTYHKSFFYEKVIKNDERIYLDLGKLSQVADVWLNKNHLGISWSQPHQFDITDIIKNGENNLKIEIANTWSNRIIGDAITGKKITRTNITKHGEKDWKDVPLLESGLMGPVKILVRKTL